MAASIDRYRGTLVGVAIGDGLGLPFEGYRVVRPSQVDAWLDDRVPLRWSDDTAMSLVLARWLAARSGGSAEVAPESLGDAFAAAYREEPWRGYGAGPPRVFADAARGTPYLEAAAALFDGGSFGNGGAMRAAPAGLAAPGDPPRAARLARGQAAVTHAHPLGQDAAVVIAVATACLTTGATPAVAIDAAVGQLETAAMRAAVQDAAHLAAADPSAVAARLGNDVTAVASVPAAVAAFLGAPDGLVDTLRRAVLVGGDTDTIAAMAGALAGAHHGLGGVPPPLLARVEARAALIEVAERLHGRFAT